MPTAVDAVSLSSSLVFRSGQFEEQRVEQWQIEWAEKGEKRAIAHRKMLEAVLAHPDNEPEKALQKTLKVTNNQLGTAV